MILSAVVRNTKSNDTQYVYANPLVLSADRTMLWKLAGEPNTASNSF